MVKLSIIIPFYKTFELTKILLEKLIPQLTDEVEVFLIDDGCNEFRLDEFKDYIEIIHLEENSGNSVARNIGIKKSTGKYIGFIDSDDLVVDDYIETLLETINNHEEEIIYFSWQDSNNGNIIRFPDNYAIWKSIYKREIVPLFIEEMKKGHEDVPFLDEINKIERTKFYIDKVLYLYNSNRVGSLTWNRKHIKE